MIITGFSGFVSTGSSPAAFSFSPYSPSVWSSSTPTSHGSALTVRLPVDAFDASSRSSISFFSRADCRCRTSIYSRIFSFSGFSLPRRST